MPTIHRRHCSTCKKYYEGRGKYFCSNICQGIADRKPIEQRYKDPNLWRKKMKLAIKIKGFGFQKGHIPITKGKSKGFYDEKGYFCYRINGKKIRRSHIVWSQHNQIPVPQGFLIHHINQITDDDRIENLAPLPRGFHTSLHQKFKKEEEATI